MPPVVLDVRKADDLRDVVHRAVQVVSEGKLAALPTETVYGLVARAVDPQAVARLIEVKGRVKGHPFTLAVKSAEEARDYVPDLSPLAQRLARRCWPGPVTLVVNDSHPEGLTRRLPPSVLEFVSPNNLVGLRVPGHPIVLDILRMLVGPLALTSANRSGAPDPRTAAEVLSGLGDDVDLVVDDGPSRFGLPSSVVRVTGNSYQVLRQGVVPLKTLRRLTTLMILFVCTGNTCRSPMAEGLCRKLLAERTGCPGDELEDHGAIVMSAGIAAGSAGDAAREAVEALAERGIDLSSHQTQPLSEPLVRHADLIYAMTQSHRQAIVAQWPDAAERVEVLSAAGCDIPDPIGGPLERYQRCAAQIEQALRARLPHWEL
jgi:protein-tyrosine phosphatase